MWSALVVPFGDGVYRGACLSAVGAVLVLTLVVLMPEAAVSFRGLLWPVVLLTDNRRGDIGVQAGVYSGCPHEASRFVVPE